MGQKKEVSHAPITNRKHPKAFFRCARALLFLAQTCPMTFDEVPHGRSVSRFSSLKNCHELHEFLELNAFFRVIRGICGEDFEDSYCLVSLLKQL